MTMLRWLIRFYLALAILNVSLAVVIAVIEVRAVATPRSGGNHVEEGIVLVAASMFTASLPLLAAWGLWRHWRFVWFVMLGISGWAILSSSLVAVVTFAIRLGLVDAAEFEFGDSPIETLAISIGTGLFAAIQIWILLRPAVRESFRRK